MSTHITLIRHGETDWNAARRYQGFAPVPLNSIGQQQAHQAAQHLCEAKIDHIVSSDLSRARETAEIIGAALGLPVHIDERLREINVGSWQGMTPHEIREWDGDRYAAYSRVPYNERQFPNGESQPQVNARALAALQDIVVQCPDQHVLVATHGGVVRGLYFALTAIESTEVVPNCSLTRLHFEVESGQWDVICLGFEAAAVKW